MPPRVLNSCNSASSAQQFLAGPLAVLRQMCNSAALQALQIFRPWCLGVSLMPMLFHPMLLATTMMIFLTSFPTAQILERGNLYLPGLGPHMFNCACRGQQHPAALTSFSPWTLRVAAASKRHFPFYLSVRRLCPPRVSQALSYLEKASLAWRECGR